MMEPKAGRQEQAAATPDIGNSWSDYWVHDGAGGEVFVSQQGDRHPALAEHWQRVFSGVQAKARVIDLASGAGSVYAHLPADHGFDLHAVDISADALEMLRHRVPGTTTKACSAADIPYDDAAFDLVVSQFGVEYAGLEAFPEAARLVSSGGKLAVICHYAGGYIDSRNRELLAGATVAKESAFVDKAFDLIEAAFSTDSDKQKQTASAFILAEKMLAAAVEKQQNGVHAHLYAGFRQLYERRRAYDKGDITRWLTQIRDELDKNIERLTHMCAAALSQDDMDTISETLGAQGLQRVTYSPFYSSGNELPIAWQLAAMRA